MPILQSPGPPVHHQHPGMIPGLHRLLGDPFGRQLVKKIAFIHEEPSSFCNLYTEFI